MTETTKTKPCFLHGGSLPPKVLPRHPVEALVVRPVEVPQPPHHLGVDVRVRPPLGLAQAVGLAAALWLLQAGEALGFVKVEMLVRHDPLETQKVLDFAQLSRRIGDEPLAADQMDLSPGEPRQPALQVLGVQADPQGAPEGVDLTCRGERHTKVLYSPPSSLFGPTPGLKSVTLLRM